MRRQDPTLRHKVRRKSDDEAAESEENILYYKKERTRDIMFEATEMDPLPEDKPRSLYQKSTFNREPLFDSVQSLAPSTPEPTTTARSGGHRFTMSWAGTSPMCNPMSPVCRSAYSSLPKRTSAAEFLANFAMSDINQEPDDIVEGTVISGRYKLSRLVGTGAYSECREGHDMKDDLKGPLAFKITRKDGESDAQHEIDIWKRLKHPGFLPLLDVIKLAKVTVTVSPYASSGNMLQYISKNGPFVEAQARRIFCQLSQATHYLHNVAGIIHRDIKLENILLDDALNSYLCDFGLSDYIETSAMNGDDEEDRKSVV